VCAVVGVSGSEWEWVSVKTREEEENEVVRATAQLLRASAARKNDRRRKAEKRQSATSLFRLRSHSLLVHSLVAPLSPLHSFPRIRVWVEDIAVGVVSLLECVVLFPTFVVSVLPSSSSLNFSLEWLNKLPSLSRSRISSEPMMRLLGWMDIASECASSWLSM